MSMTVHGHGKTCTQEERKKLIERIQYINLTTCAVRRKYLCLLHVLNVFHFGSDFKSRPGCELFRKYNFLMDKYAQANDKN